mmetsp:Transcript_60099/g.183595  ORF Transcript_60099/g.183595 Transcript_60099/m.183595 type:complete len:227 (+) Transcript_60099:299-979(+)
MFLHRRRRLDHGGQGGVEGLFPREAHRQGQRTDDSPDRALHVVSVENRFLDVRNIFLVDQGGRGGVGGAKRLSQARRRLLRALCHLQHVLSRTYVARQGGLALLLFVLCCAIQHVNLVGDAVEDQDRHNGSRCENRRGNDFVELVGDAREHRHGAPEEKEQGEPAHAHPARCLQARHSARIRGSRNGLRIVVTLVEAALHVGLHEKEDDEAAHDGRDGDQVVARVV